MVLHLDVHVSVLYLFYFLIFCKHIIANSNGWEYKNEVVAMKSKSKLYPKFLIFYVQAIGKQDYEKMWGSHV